ncbi:hypothetical protein QOZ80_1AG0022180 [Eleusine coracana subsp. coracana]|nr:hypothetical protein QOZ80_1AG0022180 [Eleusine coracana subsp. coracana]
MAEEQGGNATAPPPWEGLPESILLRASAFLPLRDRVRMACVNKHWLAAVTGLAWRAPRFPPALPWLIFPSTEEPTFFSALDRRFHRLCHLPADVRRARLCGSAAGGWLVLTLNSRHAYALYHLDSGRRIALPPQLVAPRGTVFPLVVRAATLSAPPLHRRHMVGAIVLAAARSAAAFWTPGRESWFSDGGLLDVTPQDVIFYGGGFYFVTPDEDILTFWPMENAEGDVAVARLDYDMEQREDFDVDVAFAAVLVTTRRYLVESRGRLLMVVRYIYHETGTRLLRVFGFRVTAPFTDVDMPRATWDDLGNRLDGRMLFLGPGCSRSFEVAHYDGFQNQESMIFFLDESFATVPSADGRRLYSFTDMGRYSMRGMNSEPWPPGPRPTSSDNAPPTWWFL